MSSPREQAVQFLARWSELSGQGREASAAELCAACPELLDELERRIGYLRQLNRLVVPEEDLPETAWGGSVASPPVGEEGLPPLLEARAPPEVPHHEVLGLLGEGAMG